MNPSRIERESEDLFASQSDDDESLKSVASNDDKEDDSNRGEEVDEDDEEQGELTAAAALTSLVSLSPHNYNAHDDDDDDDDEDDRDFEIPQRFTKSGRKRAVPFPVKLMKVLSNKKYSDVIAWTPSGKSFNVVKPKQFTVDVLPTHFKSAKYSSFTRKLHRWGFMRHYRGEEAGAYYHKLFLRDRLDMVEQMTCHKQEIIPKSKPAMHQHKIATAAVAPVLPPPTTTAAAIASAASAMSPVRQSIVPPPARALRAPPLTAEDLNAIQRNMVSMFRQQQQQHHVPPPPAPVALPSSLTSEVVDPRRVVGNDLNAAIEMEVNRRLKERIAAATFSRQALALMQQQQQLREQAAQHLQQQQQRQQQQQSVFENARMLLSQTPAPQPQLNLQSQQVLELAEFYKKIKQTPQQAYFAFGTAPCSLPETNIQGAKTA